MSLANVIQRRRTALVRRWAQDPLLLVQVEAPQALANLVFLNDAAGSGQVGSLGRRSATNVALVRRPGDPDSEASVWVAASYSGYRSAYLAFVREVYGIDAGVADLAGHDVDHLLNRARSPNDSTFIRIEAVPSFANQEWGRLFERAASDPAFYANQARQRRTMSWMICAKLAGRLPPRGPGDAAGIAQLVAWFGSLGIPAAEAREGLTSMLGFAYRR